MAELKNLLVTGAARVDGMIYGDLTGTASNADTLDGQHGSYFQPASTAINTGNIGSQSVSYATNAGQLGGLSLHSGRNNEANKVVRTDSNGYAQFGWINTTSGGMNNTATINGVANVPSAIDRIYCSDDQYLRYASPAMFKRALGLAERVHYGSQNTPNTYCVIRIKSYTSWMLYFKVRVYQNYSYYDIDISGYNYGSNYWYSPAATLVSSKSDNIAVYFGYDSVSHLWVAFKTSSYIGVDVVDAVNGYTQVDNIGNLFSIEWASSITNIQSTVTAYNTVHTNDSRLTNARPANGGNSDTVDGYHISVGSSAGSNSSTVYIVI